MNFLEWMGVRKIMDGDDNVIKFNKPKEIKPVEPVKPAIVPKQQEHYRVGYSTETKMVTITFMSDNGHTMTLSLADREVEHFIRMVGAARRPEKQEQDET